MIKLTKEEIVEFANEHPTVNTYLLLTQLVQFQDSLVEPYENAEYNCCDIFADMIFDNAED